LSEELQAHDLLYNDSIANYPILLHEKLAWQVCERNPRHYVHVKNPHLLNNVEFAKSIQKRLPCIDLQLFGPLVRCNHDIVFQCISRNGLQLRYADTSLQDDMNVVKRAMKQSKGAAFQYASPRLRSNIYLALKAIKHCTSMFDHVHESLYQNKDFIIQALSVKPKVWNLLPRELQQDEGLIHYMQE
jgi:hypothetical protein